MLERPAWDGGGHSWPRYWRGNGCLDGEREDEVLQAPRGEVMCPSPHRCIAGPALKPDSIACTLELNISSSPGPG